MHRCIISRIARPCWLLPVCLSGCVGWVAHKQTYSQESGPHHHHGAEIRLQVKPEGTQKGSFAVSAMVVSAAMAHLDGPFRWRFVATGKQNEHTSMVVHRIVTRTSNTRKTEVFPAEKIRNPSIFRPVSKQPGTCRAICSPPGLLQVRPEEDGALHVLAEISITRLGSTKRQSIGFQLKPTRKSQREWLFIPAEFAQSIGKPLEESDETSWD